MLRPRLLLRRLRLMPRQIRKSPGALKVVTAQPRVDVPTEKRGYHCSMPRRGYGRLQRRITGAILTGKQSCQVPPRHQFLSRNSHQNSHRNRVRSRRIMLCSVLNSRVQPLHSQERMTTEIVSGPAASPCSVLFLTVVYNRCILKKEH
jgi:hypothetical protein